MIEIIKSKKRPRQSFLSRIYKGFLDLLNLNRKLAVASFEQLQLLEDTITPIRKGYEEEVIKGARCWWINRAKINNGILVYIPGGGFVMGPLTLHWKYCDQMSKHLNMAVLVIRYRLAPDFPFPIGLNDVVEAITTLQAQGTLLQKWYLAGDSAGGNLALGTCYQLAAHKAVLPKKLVLMFPTVDMTINENEAEIVQLSEKDLILSPAFAEKVKKAYVGHHDLRDSLLSPVNGELDILPPILLQHSSDDILVTGSRKLEEKMRKANKAIHYEEYEGMYHGFTLSPGLPEAKKAIRSQLAFLKQ